ncbi:hypothetical protein [Spirosoma lituiforme]
MIVKLKLRLKSGEVIALSKHLASTLTLNPIEELRKEPSDLMIMSALYELYAKVKEKSENIRIFKASRNEELYSVTITRTQALALICAGYFEVDSPTAMQSYEGNFIQSLIGRIHQTFLV